MTLTDINASLYIDIGYGYHAVTASHQDDPRDVAL